jgi:hypothetical protein
MVPHQKDAIMKSHISRWESSGLTQIAYCNQHDIKPHVFSYYKGKLSRGGRDSEQLSSRLVPVELLSSNAPLTKQAADSDQIKISHNNGFSIEVKICSELSLLKPLLDLVRSIA